MEREADEVEVFETFGGDLSVKHQTENQTAKGTGDRSDKLVDEMQQS